MSKLHTGCLATLLALFSAQSAFANEFTGAPLLLAELIVGPESSTQRAPSGASRSRAKAATYQEDRVPVLIEEEAGILQPRGGAPAEERAFEQRNRARASQQGTDQLLPMPLPGSMTVDPGSQPRSSDARNKARAYTGTGNLQDVDLSNVGRDGLPIVDCHNVDNVSGRIGDDTLSGAIVFLMRNSMQVKVRCR